MQLQAGDLLRRFGWMMAEQVLTGSLAGATFTLTCDAPDFTAYAARHLAPLARPAGSTPAVTAVLRWHDAQPSRQRPQASMGRRVDRLDRDLYRIGDTLFWYRVDDLRDLHLRCVWDGERLQVHGDFYHRLGSTPWSDRLRRLTRWRQRLQLRRRRFTTLLYYLVYYPCWWWLEHTRGLHPLHAGGVCTEGGALLLAGASGIGKSSLTAALAAAPGARLLSDSFVLHRGADVLPVREPLLLDDWSRRWLGESVGILRPLHWRYGLERSGYLVAAERLAEEGRAVLLIFPRRSSQAYVQALTSQQARQQLSALNLIINDLRRYWAFAAVLEQLAPRGLVSRREAELARLTEEVPAYDVGLTEETSSAAAVESLQRLVQGAVARMAGASA